MRQSYCNCCHAMIWWGVTRNGKQIPLEADGWAVPNPGGEVMWDEFGGQFRGVPVASPIPRAVKCFRPHFIYCPYADQMRKPKEKSAWRLELEKKRAEEAEKKAAAEVKRADKARIAAAAAEFEARQYSMFDQNAG